MGAPLASLYTGLGLLVVTVLLALLVRRAVASEPEAPSRHQTPAAEARLEDSLRPLIGDSAVRWTRDNSSLVAIGALAAGVLITSQPGHAALSDPRRRAGGDAQGAGGLPRLFQRPGLSPTARSVH